MVAHHFLESDELVEWLLKAGDTDEHQVEERGYNPPRRERILEWQSQQDFPICRTPTIPMLATSITSCSYPMRSTRTSRSTARNGKPPTLGCVPGY
jgi:hypothetical protein